MKRFSILNKLQQTGIIAVIRGNSIEDALKLSKEIVAGGIKALEITFTIDQAEKLIKQLKKEYEYNQDVVIGAGTVLDPTTARIAIMAGAEYIVSPSFDKNTAKICNLYQIPYIPGCLSIEEIQKALTYGSDIIKLFPGNVLKPEFIKSVKGPLPYVNIMPSGGVNLNNIKEWVNAGAIAVSVGGNLTTAEDGSLHKSVKKIAQEYQLTYESAKRGDKH